MVEAYNTRAQNQVSVTCRQRMKLQSDPSVLAGSEGEKGAMTDVDD